MSVPVRKRRVFYLSGFDPRGVAAYHRLFMEESQKQSQLMGWTMKVGPRKRRSTLSSEWQVERCADEGNISTTFDFLHWDDIVRRHWHGGLFRLYALALKTYWQLFFTTGTMTRMLRESKWGFITLLAPAIVFFLAPLLALITGGGTYLALSHKLPAGHGASIASGFAALLAVCWLGIWLERKLSLGWLLRTYAFSLEYDFGNIMEMNDRIRKFSDHIESYLESASDDEVLIVGHSYGANMSISVLARMLQDNPAIGSQIKHWGLLTLGGSIALQGRMSSAAAFRSDLLFLNQYVQLPWIDISAQEDLASFAALNAVPACGVPQTSASAERPRILSGAFKEILLPTTYARASWDLFRMHFQYLMAHERPQANDYFSVTTGSETFARRFGCGVNSG